VSTYKQWNKKITNLNQLYIKTAKHNKWHTSYKTIRVYKWKTYHTTIAQVKAKIATVEGPV